MSSSPFCAKKLIITLTQVIILSDNFEACVKQYGQWCQCIKTIIIIILENKKLLIIYTYINYKVEYGNLGMCMYIILWTLMNYNSQLRAWLLIIVTYTTEN